MSDPNNVTSSMKRIAHVFSKNNEINDSLVPPTKIRNGMSEDISNAKSKKRQDVRDLRYTKNHSLLNLRFSRHKRSTRS